VKSPRREKVPIDSVGSYIAKNQTFDARYLSEDVYDLDQILWRGEVLSHGIDYYNVWAEFFQPGRICRCTDLYVGLAR
jgi:hypothetical protein